jgi:hypothetical protein
MNFTIFAKLMKQLFPILMFLLMSACAHSQIGIGTNTPNTSSLLDVSSIDKGLLIPRLSTLQRVAIVATTQSLTVFDTDVNLYYYFNTTNLSWSPINVCTVKTIPTAGVYALSDKDNGQILDFTSSSAVLVRIPGTLPKGFQVSITQAGAGVINFAGTFGMNLNNRYGGFKTAGRWAKVGIEVKSSTVCVISGDVN